MEELINTKQLSKILNRSISSIQRDVKKGLPCIKLLSGAVKYRLSEVEKWVNSYAKTNKQRK